MSETSSARPQNVRTSPTQRSEEPDRFVRWWPLVIAAAVLVNVFQFPGVETSANRTYKAIPPYESADVREIAASHSSTVRLNWGLEFTLAKWTSHATLTVSDSSLGLSDMYIAFDRVEFADYDPSLSSAVASMLTDHIVATGEDTQLGEYEIAVGPDGTADRFILVFDGGRPIFTDQSLLPEGYAGDSP